MNSLNRTRAVAIILKNREILLMHRIKKGREYYVFPGGGVEEGESPEDAVMREIAEETRLTIIRGKLLYRHLYEDIRQEHMFYLCRYISGEPKLGEANEKEAMRDGKENFYEPIWVKISDLHMFLLYPLEIRDWLIEDAQKNFQDTPRKAVLKYSELRN